MPSVASIRSLRNGGTPVVNASRDDLVLGDTVTVSSVNAGTAYSWSLAYAPEGSDAAFSGNPTDPTPGSFIVDVEGSYLIRLVLTNGLTSTEQFVRLRAITTIGGLKLVAAGERYDTLRVPVDASPTGWADEQNFNLRQLESLIGPNSHTERLKLSFTFESASPITVSPLYVGDVLLKVALRITEPFDGASASITVGDPVEPEMFFPVGASVPDLQGLYINEVYEDILVEDSLVVTLTPNASTTGAGFFVFDLYRA